MLKQDNQSEIFADKYYCDLTSQTELPGKDPKSEQKKLRETKALNLKKKIGDQKSSVDLGKKK